MPLLCPEGYIVERLNSQHDCQSFSCGKIQLDAFIREQATQGGRKQTSATHVLVALENISTIVGYVTLVSATIPFHELPRSLAKKLNLPTKGWMPATLLARLAVNSQYQKRGFGKFLLLYALDICQKLSTEIASCMVVLDAIDEDLKRWYSSYGFVPLKADSMRLVLPMATVRTLLQNISN